MNLVIICVVGLALCLHVADSVKCYECTALDDNCKTGECNGEYCSKVSDDGSVHKGAVKNCLPAGDNKCTTRTVLGVTTITCTCNTDWCNGSQSNGKVTMAILTLAIGIAFGGSKLMIG